MNGIRLAVFAIAALGFLLLDLSNATAQRGRPQGYSNQRQGMSPMIPSAPSAPPSRNNSNNNTQTDRDDAARTSRSSRSSRSRSSRGGNNAIKSNPLFKFLDTNRDGELSLEEIDAASRMLYSLDSNEDDSITADEVQDMVAGGGMGSGSGDHDEKMMEKDDPSSARSARSNRTASRGRAKRGGPQAVSGPVGAGGMSKAGGMTPGGMTPGGMSPGGMSPGGGSKKNMIAEDDFEGHDKNEDGFITRGEMPRSLRNKFTRMDANSDKEIDEDEWYDYLDNNK